MSSSSGKSRWLGGGSSRGKVARAAQAGGGALHELAIPEMEGEAEPEPVEPDDGIDAEAERLIKASEFESMILDGDPEAFDGARLIETLTRHYIADAGGGAVALDPQALKKLFATTRTMLSRMAADVAANTEAVEAEAPAMEEEYRQGISRHVHRLEAVVGDLGLVDKRFRDVADKAVRIGDRLSKLEAQRQRVSDAMDVLGYFRAFETLPTPVDGSGSSEEHWRDLPAIFSEDSNDSRAAAAAALAKMKAIAYEMDMADPALDRAVKNMQAYSDFVESELLELFERAAGRLPPEVTFMRECADVLFVLNEGEHLQSRYVFFVVSQRLVRNSNPDGSDSGGGGNGGRDGGSSSRRRGSVDGSSGGGGAGSAYNGVGNSASGGGGSSTDGAYDSLSALFGKVIDVCQSEFGLIVRAFPPPLVPKVTKLLLQRILNDPVYGIQARVDAVLSPPPPQEPLPLADYLNCLCTVEQKIMALFELLKHQELQLYSGGDDADGENGYAGDYNGTNGLLDSGNGNGSDDGYHLNGGGGNNPAEDGLNSGANHGEGGSDGSDSGNVGRSHALALRTYLDDQARHLFFEHRNGYPAKETRYLMQCLLETLEGAWEGVLLYQVTGPAMLASLESFPLVQEEKVGSYLNLLSGPLRPGMTTNVLSLHAEAVRRCRTILQGDEEREQRVAQHFQVVCRFLADHAAVPALRAAAHLLPTPTSNAAAAAIKEMKGEGTLPPRVFYEVVKAAGLLSAKLQAHHRDVVAPGMAGAPTLRTIALETRNAFVQRVAVASAKAAQRALELVVAYAERQLSSGRPLRNDYCPREDGSAPVEATKSTRALCAVLKEQHSVATECLKEMDLTAVWTAVGLKVHRLFVDHIKKVRVNVTGAFILTSDVNLLTEVLGTFGCPKVDAGLELLREIVKLLLVPPENLPSLMEAGRLASLSRFELRDFCKVRADFYSHPGIKSNWARELFPNDKEDDRPLPPPPPPPRPTAFGSGSSGSGSAVGGQMGLGGKKMDGLRERLRR